MKGRLPLAPADELPGVEERFGMPRRQFLTFCAGLAAVMGLPRYATAQVADAIVHAKRPSVIWLQFQECTGCTESLLRAEHPTLEKLILNVISLDYHETLMAAAGHQAEEARHAAMAANKGKYILVVEGAIPTGLNGNFCRNRRQDGRRAARGVRGRRRRGDRHRVVRVVGRDAVDVAQPDRCQPRRGNPRQARA